MMRPIPVLRLLLVIGLSLATARSVSADDVADQADERRFREILNSPAEVRAHQESLRSLLEQLLQAHSLPVAIDDQALSDSGVSLDPEMDLAVQGVTVRSVLNQLLTPRGLTWQARHGRFLITTLDKVEGEPVVRHYPAGPLAGSDTELRKLARLIPDLVSPDTWDILGGTGQLSTVRGGWIIRQSVRVHAEVEALLQEMEQAQGRGDGPSLYGPVNRVIRTEEQLRAALQTRLDVRFQQADIASCLEKLRELSPAPFWFDAVRLTSDGAELSKDRTFDADQATLESILNQVLADTHVTWSLGDEGIVLSVKENEPVSRVQLYDVTELPDQLVLSPEVRMPTGATSGSLGFGGGWGGGGGGFFQFGGGGGAGMAGGGTGGGGLVIVPQPQGVSPTKDGGYETAGLAGLLEAVVAPDTWTSAGGNGAIARHGDLLLVRQTPTQHQAIAQTLSGLRTLVAGMDRETLGAKQTSDDSFRTVLYRCQGESADNLKQLLLNLDDPIEWETAGAAADNLPPRGRVATVTQGLVIRQTVRQHRRIERWLERLGVLERVIDLDDQDAESPE